MSFLRNSIFGDVDSKGEVIDRGFIEVYVPLVFLCHCSHLNSS